MTSPLAVILIIFLVLLAVMMIAFSLGLRLLEAYKRRQVEHLVAAVEGTAGEPPPEEALLLGRPPEKLELAVRSGKWDRYIQQSGLSWTVTYVVIASSILAIAGGALGWYLRPLGFLYLSTAALACLGFYLPMFIVRWKRTDRLAQIERQLPEALEFLARSMRAGHAFSISLEMLGRELPDPLGLEFRTLFHELNLGATTDAALHNLSLRAPVLDLRLFVSSVLLQKQTGGNLSEILVRLAYVIRERFRLRGQVRVASAHGRLTAVVLTALPILLVFALMLIAPEYLKSLAEDPEGKWLIAGAICAQLVAYYIMHRIVDIKA